MPRRSRWGADLSARRTGLCRCRRRPCWSYCGGRRGMGRWGPAARLGVLGGRADRAAWLGLLPRETSTFGVRVREGRRPAAARETRRVETPFGPVQVKLKILDGTVAGAAPEY